MDTRISVTKYALMMESVQRPFTVVALSGGSELENRLTPFLRKNSVGPVVDRAYFRGNDGSCFHYMLLMNGEFANVEDGKLVVPSSRRVDLVLESLVLDGHVTSVGFARGRTDVEGAYSDAIRAQQDWKRESLPSGIIVSSPAVKKTTRKVGRSTGLVYS